MITHGSISFVQYKHKLCFNDRNCLARTVITLQSYQLQYSTVQKLQAPRMFCFSSAKGCSIQRPFLRLRHKMVMQGVMIQLYSKLLHHHYHLGKPSYLDRISSANFSCSNVWALIFLKVHPAQPSFLTLLCILQINCKKFLKNCCLDNTQQA